MFYYSIFVAYLIFILIKNYYFYKYAYSGKQNNGFIISKKNQKKKIEKFGNFNTNLKSVTEKNNIRASKKKNIRCSNKSIDRMYKYGKNYHEPFLLECQREINNYCNNSSKIDMSVINNPEDFYGKYYIPYRLSFDLKNINGYNISKYDYI